MSQPGRNNYMISPFIQTIVFDSHNVDHTESINSPSSDTLLKVQLGSEVQGGILASVDSVCLGIGVAQQVSDEPDPGSCSGQRVKLTSVGKYNTHSHKCRLLEALSRRPEMLKRPRKLWRDETNRMGQMNFSWRNTFQTRVLTNFMLSLKNPKIDDQDSACSEKNKKWIKEL